MTLEERIARALCRLDIQQKRRFDTSSETLANMLDKAVDYHWPNYTDQAQAALEAMISEGAISEAMHLAGRTEMRSLVELYEGEIYFEAFAPDKVFTSIIKAAIAER